MPATGGDVPTVGNGELSYVAALGATPVVVDALADLAGAARQRVTPLLDVPRDAAVASVGRLEPSLRRLLEVWPADRPVWLDAAQRDLSSSREGELLDQLRLVPVGGPARGAQHADVVGRLAASHGHGAVLRVDPGEFADLEQLELDVASWLDAVGLAADDVELLVDFQAFMPVARPMLQLAALAVLPQLPDLERWRSLTLLSGTLPAAGEAREGSPLRTIPRSDWELWQDVANARLPRTPGFGDYATGGWANDRALGPVRYCAEGHWVIGVHPDYDWRASCSRAASKALRAHPAWAGPGHCSGCRFIEVSARGYATGDPTAWQRAGIVHHLTSVVQQLSRAGRSRPSAHEQGAATLPACPEQQR